MKRSRVASATPSPATCGVEEKKMFGGLGFLLYGNILVGVWKDALIVRVGPDHYGDALVEPHVREFDITGKPMKGWVLVESEGVEDDDRLRGMDSAGDVVGRNATQEIGSSTMRLFRQCLERRRTTALTNRCLALAKTRSRPGVCKYREKQIETRNHDSPASSSSSHPFACSTSSRSWAERRMSSSRSISTSSGSSSSS